MAATGSRSFLTPMLRLARAASLICLGFLLLMVAGEAFLPHAPLPGNARDIIGLILFPGVYALGLLLAWWQELPGGLISLFSMIAFYGWLGWQDGSLPRGWILPLLVLPAALFLFHGCCLRASSEDQTV